MTKQSRSPRAVMTRAPWRVRAARISGSCRSRSLATARTRPSAALCNARDVRGTRRSTSSAASGGGVRLHGHERARRLAPSLVGPGDDRRLHDLRMAVEHFLDLERGDVFAARDDDVLRAVLDLDIAVRVHDREVAGVKPAAGRRLPRWPPGSSDSPSSACCCATPTRRSWRRRPARRPSSGGSTTRWPSSVRLAPLAAPYAPARSADGQPVPRLLPGADRRRAVAFGQPIEMGDAKPHPLHRLDHRRGRCRAAGRGLDDMVKAALDRIGRMHQHVQHDRRAAQMRHAMLGDRAKIGAGSTRRRQTWVPATAVTAQG